MRNEHWNFNAISARVEYLSGFILVRIERRGLDLTKDLRAILIFTSGFVEWDSARKYTYRRRKVWLGHITEVNRAGVRKGLQLVEKLKDEPDSLTHTFWWYIEKKISPLTGKKEQSLIHMFTCGSFFLQLTCMTALHPRSNVWRRFPLDNSCTYMADYQAEKIYVTLSSTLLLLGRPTLTSSM